MTTIKDIAQKCNVSIATVSNVINDRGKVSKETKDLIWKTAREMNYVPNFMARNLKQRQTKNIGIIAEDLTIFHTPAVVDGINSYLDEKGYTFLLGNLRMFQKHGDEFYIFPEYEGKVLEELNIMASKQVSGIIYIEGHCHTITCIPENFSIPIVAAYGFIEKEGVPSVLYNDEQGAWMATSALLKKGCKEIGMITGMTDSYHTRMRMQGYHKALYEQKIPFNPQWVAEGDWTKESGYRGAEKLMRQGIRAIFSMNDLMAGGVYDYMRENGYQIGKDVLLVGFDDREICKAYYPALSSVHLPLFELGRYAAKLLLDLLEEDKPSEEKNHYINCSLKYRESL
ncbi:LacI family DNA-binding transcriptional regulator [Novisyntrophococcus fermenticellae]|uniref:LacI family DNA-binding transcriptional regulator n=1 Tax=Novisyntrophococcus fermenticellae TaxID=2068655 RepID=UPI001E5C744F|nr:LacI family DNA-binding transcriptional regulator [Novisyntrophococcus fermenticellae]